MLETYNVIMTEDDFGITMTSPQLPSLIFGRPTKDAFQRDYKDALRWAGLKQGHVVGHWQRRGETPAGDEYVVRWQTGKEAHEEERLRVANQLNQALAAGEEQIVEILDELEPSATGEYVFVACLADDTVGWLIDQLRAEGDVLVVGISVAGMMVAMTQIARDPRLDWPSLDDLGWSRDTSLGQLLSNRRSAHPMAVRA